MVFEYLKQQLIARHFLGYRAARGKENSDMVEQLKKRIPEAIAKLIR
jgi:hypothetical protein